MSRKVKAKRKTTIIVAIFLVFISLLIYFLIELSNKRAIKVVSKISDYNYTLDDRDTTYMKSEFDVLKEVLSKKEVDYKKYAESLSKLFIIDLYTIDNKLNKYDIGSIEYLYPEKQENFKLKAQDTLYKYLVDSSKRKEKMPIVKMVSIVKVDEDTFKYGEKEYKSYVVTLSWKYEKDLGYDSKGVISLIKDNNKLYIASFTPEVEDE